MKILILFSLILCSSCELSDPGIRAYTFDYEWVPVRNTLNKPDYSKSYKIVVLGTLDNVNFYAVDTLYCSIDSVYVKQYKK